MSKKPWSVKAEMGGSITSVPIMARCSFTAVALAAKEIAGRSVADPRWRDGKITILDPDGKAIYQIPDATSQEKPGFIKNNKEES